ncbi:MAG: hypothetical protein R6V19_08760 [Armatimonadota bacterium]
MTMRVRDFCRSFVTFEIFEPANNARIQVEATCTVTQEGHEPVEYTLVASCKSEDMYLDDNLFKTPNYDFCAIFSDDEYRIHRVGLTADAHEMEAGLSADRFHDVRFTVRECDAEELPDAAAVVEATSEGRIIVCRTRIEEPDTGFSALLEYPVKTMNVRRDPAAYQVDTGPVILPGLWGETTALEDFRLAYIVYNRADRAEFVIQEPTLLDPDDPDSAHVMHYSRTHSMSAENTLYACD